MLQRLFLEHPSSLGESYTEHQRHAFSFGASMVVAGLACLLHGICPALFEETGSRAVARLHERMTQRRIAAAPQSARPGVGSASPAR